MADDSLANEVKSLRSAAEFQLMPSRMRQWIEASPNAVADFDQFFKQGGKFETGSNVDLPYYHASTPPRIYLNQEQWHQLQKDDAPLYPQLHAFGTLAHEIGHDRYNTGVTPFTGKTANEYVQYRSELEAQAIFNAFPIFKDLEKHPDFAQMGLPFNSIGYLSGLELAVSYKQWRSGEIEDKAVVERIAAQVPERPYTLGSSLRDQNADGRLTHRDAYLSDYARYVAPKLSPQAPPVHYDGPSVPAEPSHADRVLLEKIREGVRGLDKQIGKPWDEGSERLSASALSMAVRMNFKPDDDVRIASNNATPTHAAGELLFVYRVGATASPDPAANFAQTPISDALTLPAQERYQQIQAMRDAQIQTQQPSPPQPDPPAPGAPAPTR
ncbi:XVIPCD domain-containing protein [Pseudomonas sp. CGJS7]|uniref:XVIPCD domain-containing protein n=1 Tax=Pseudomonas sp. CGJS7 TaxID=3109348 RepID=UPI0030081736